MTVGQQSSPVPSAPQELAESGEWVVEEVSVGRGERGRAGS